MDRLPALAVAIFVGCAVAVVPTVLQPHFKAESVPDLICYLILAPGQMMASLFHDRGTGTASPEFLWLSWMATVILFGAAAYGFLSIKKPSV